MTTTIAIQDPLAKLSAKGIEKFLSGYLSIPKGERFSVSCTGTDQDGIIHFQGLFSYLLDDDTDKEFRFEAITDVIDIMLHIEGEFLSICYKTPVKITIVGDIVIRICIPLICIIELSDISLP